MFVINTIDALLKQVKFFQITLFALCPVLRLQSSGPFLNTAFRFPSLGSRYNFHCIDGPRVVVGNNPILFDVRSSAEYIIDVLYIHYLLSSQPKSYLLSLARLMNVILRSQPYLSSSTRLRICQLDLAQKQRRCVLDKTLVDSVNKQVPRQNQLLY